MKKYIPALSVLIFFILIATLFPPYNWGTERLRTKSERVKIIPKVGYLNDILPIKQYDFLFDNSKQEIFIGWGYDHSKPSIRKYLILERHLIVEELLLNYLLSMILASIILLYPNKLESLLKNKRLMLAVFGLILLILVSVIIYNLVSENRYKKQIVDESLFKKPKVESLFKKSSSTGKVESLFK